MPLFVLKERADADCLKRITPAVIPYCFRSGPRQALDLTLANRLAAPHLSPAQRSFL
jgi:hypothetical protein